MNRIPWSIDDIMQATKGDLLSAGAAGGFEGIAIDSRIISGNELFVAIRGEVHDGHQFVESVVAGGVKGVLVDRRSAEASYAERWRGKGVACIVVKDTTTALGALAAYNRKRAGVRVIAITGSNGKTTTRQMTAAVLSGRFDTLVPQGNFNNEIGLPLTLLSLCSHHELAVLELGMNHPGEIRRLGRICRPDIGMITNIGPAHLEGVGSIEGVTEAKAELLETISADGTIVLNADDSRVFGLSDRAAGREIRSFGISDKADIRGSEVVADAESVAFILSFSGESTFVRLRISGAFMVLNALSAAAVGHCLGLTAEEIKKGLESFRPVGKRLNILELGSGVRVMDDTYNANPGSMVAAIETLRSLKGGHRAIMVAGDMLELGKQAETLHRKIGAAAGRSGVSRLYLTGEFAEAAAAGAIREKMDRQHIVIGSKEEIVHDLTQRLQSGDWVLVKGSRGMKMETVVDGLKKWDRNL